MGALWAKACHSMIKIMLATGISFVDGKQAGRELGVSEFLCKRGLAQLTEIRSPN